MAKKYKLWISLFLVTPATVHPTHSCSIIRAVGILSLKQYFHQILQQWLLSEEIWTPKYNAQGPLLQLHSYISPLFPLILVTLWDWVFYIYICTVISVLPPSPPPPPRHSLRSLPSLLSALLATYCI